MPEDGSARGDDDGEPSRQDRELIELLNELRVVLPGVQVMLAFLLTVPFTQRFEELTSGETATFYVAFAATTVAVAFLVAPSAHHRVRWRQHDKERLLRLANAFSIVGIVALAVALGAVAYLITDIVYASPWGSIAAATLVALVVLLWFVLPLLSRRTGSTEPAELPLAPQPPTREQ